MSYPILSREYTWWRGDPLPALPDLRGFQAMSTDDIDLVTAVTLDPADVQTRMAAGHRIYVALLHDTPVGYGWLATQRAEIAERNLTWLLPPDDRHLWDFVTLPAWRGRGVYPHLLQAILHQEQDVRRFWIGHLIGNSASQRGIEKAGFHLCAFVVREPGGELALAPQGDPARARANPMGQALGFVHVPQGELRTTGEGASTSP